MATPPKFPRLFSSFLDSPSSPSIPYHRSILFPSPSYPIRLLALRGLDLSFSLIMHFTRVLSPLKRIPLSRQCTRCYHGGMPKPVIPPPIPFVPDAPTFLTAIGRGLSAHASKFPTWSSLFTTTSAQMREAGVEPARSRRYLLWWLERYRNGEYGIGGDFTQVKDGVAELRVVEVPIPGKEGQGATATRSPGVKKVVANVSVGSRMKILNSEKVTRPRGFKVVGANTIIGSHSQPIAGTGGMSAQVIMKEGIWEERRGHKVDGGERRKAEVRFKRRAAERKAARA